MVLDHSCDKLPDVGGYNLAEHPIAAWLKAKNVESIQVLFTIGHEAMITDGCDPPAHVWEQLVAIEECCNSAKQDENRHLRFMGFTSNNLAECMNSKALAGILRPPTYLKQDMHEQSINVPVAGTALQAAMLRKARRSSTVTFSGNDAPISSQTAAPSGGAPSQ